MTDDIPELSTTDFARAISAGTRRRLGEGRITSGDDVATIRTFVGLTVEQFAEATGATVETVRDWESGKHTLDGPAIRRLALRCGIPAYFWKVSVQRSSRPLTDW